MNTSEQFCLKWNDFSENILSTFIELRTENDLSDVTLACEDGSQIEAHKLVLSAGSHFFRNLLRKKKRETPMIYMRGLKSSELTAIVDFLYLGEVNIPETELNSFLLIAEELQLQGLAGGGEMNKKSIEEEINTNKKYSSRTNQMDDITKHVEVTKEELDSSYIKPPTISKDYPVSSGFTGQIVNMTDNDDLNQKMTELIEWNGETWSCTVCGKMANKTPDGKKNLKRHTQTHLDGVSYPCNLCGKEFRSSVNLCQHLYRLHKSAQV